MNNSYEQYSGLSTTCISDALKGLNNMTPAIKPLKEGYKTFGPACTVKMLPNDNLIVLKGIYMANPGDILVIDAKGYDNTAVVGDLIIGMAKALGLGGVVIDGAIRDVIQIKALDFPVFCRTNTTAAPAKVGNGEVNSSISCGGARVTPGDLIAGDADGVVAIPKEQIMEVLIAAKQKELKDEETAESVLKSPETVRKYLENLLNLE